MRFAYKAISPEGRKVHGHLEASNGLDLETRLKRMDLELITGQPAVQGHFGKRRMDRREIINFCFHVEQLSEAGVPLLDGLKELRDSVERGGPREVIASLIESIDGGQTLSQALAVHPAIFSPVFVNLVNAGEVSG